MPLVTSQFEFPSSTDFNDNLLGKFARHDRNEACTHMVSMFEGHNLRQSLNEKYPPTH